MGQLQIFILFANKQKNETYSQHLNKQQRHTRNNGKVVIKNNENMYIVTNYFEFSIYKFSDSETNNIS